MSTGKRKAHGLTIDWTDETLSCVSGWSAEWRPEEPSQAAQYDAHLRSVVAAALGGLPPQREAQARVLLGQEL